MLSLRRSLCCVAILWIGGSLTAAAAQSMPYTVETKPPRGFMPGTDQLTSPIDSIEPFSGKLSVQVPLASLPKGPGGSGFDLNLTYDSRLYDMTAAVQAPPPWYLGPPYPPVPMLFRELQTADTTGGWRYNYENYRLELETHPNANPSNPGCGIDGQPVERPYRLRVGLADGSLHTLHLRGWGGEVNNPDAGSGYYAPDPSGRIPSCAPPGYTYAASGWLTYFTTDGSYLKVEIHADGTDWTGKEWYLYLPDGGRVIGKAGNVKEIYDANGNRIRVLHLCHDASPPCGDPYTAIVDDAGREVRIDYTGINPGRDEIAATGPNGTMTWTVDRELLHIGGDGRTYQWSDTPSWEETKALDHWIWSIKKVQLPLTAAVGFNDTPPVWNSYVFGYSLNASQNEGHGAGYGELDSVRVPGGALYEYRYLLEGQSASTEQIMGDNRIVNKKITHDGVTDLEWTYTREGSPSSHVTVTAPDGSAAVYWAGPAGSYTNPSSLYWPGGPYIYRIDEPNGSVRKRVWAQNIAPGVHSGQAASVNNPYVQKETVTVGNASGNASQTAVTETVLDKNGNGLEKREYDWTGYNASGPESGGTLKRVTKSSYWVAVPDASWTLDYAGAYWMPHTGSQWPVTESRRLNAVKRTEVSADGTISTAAAATEYEYDNPVKNGNVTVERRWDSGKSGVMPQAGQFHSGNSQILTRAYSTDGKGNLVDIFAPEIRTHITYDATGSYPTRVDYAYGDAAQRSWTYNWNVNAGSLTSKTDLDNTITTSYSYDIAGRPTVVNEAGLRRTTTIYDDANARVTTKRDLTSFGDEKLQGYTQYDQLGRPTLVHSSEPGTSGINVKTTYLTTLNRKVSSSPYRSASDPALEWTCMQTDFLKRPTAVAIFKGSTEPGDCGSASNRTGLTTTVYDANQTTVTDPAGQARREVRDGLGRLTQVVEDPSGLNYGTSYSYNTLDNLTQVSQGAQTRTFQYSSLGRLNSAANPESGTTQYTYLDSGDLSTRTDARGVAATFTYDGLHRIKTKGYTFDPAGTYGAAYTYHLAGAASPKVGQLYSVTTALAGSYNDNYDVLGRVTASRQTIEGNPAVYSFQYSYRLNNAVQTVTNPSGRVISYDVDDAGRTEKVYAGTKVYADLRASTTSPNLPYTPDGRIAQMKLGNNLWETRVYSVPGSPTLFKIGTSQGGNNLEELEYNFNGTANNGNLQSHVIRQPNRTWTQSYGYDGVNRLTSAAESGGWSQAFGYDQYGNRWVSSSSGLQWNDTHEPAAQSNFNTSTNRLGLQGSTYDAAGNQTFFAPFALKYDAENRMIEAKDTDTHMSTYVYDGDGKRVKKIVTSSPAVSATTYYVYNALGQLAAEYSTQAPTTGTTYIHTDMLGSTRMVTDQNGAAVECYDYMPFGRLLSDGVNSRNTGCYPPNPDSQIASNLPQKFTGKERDAETKLDFFESRYYSGAQGRFTSADNLMGKPEWLPDPQRWNRYAYVRNNPLKFIDPTGEDLIIYYSFSSDLDTDELDWFKKNMSGILSGIKDKFKKAGVKNVELRDRTSLNANQLKKLDEASRRDQGIDGVFQLQFASETAWGSKSVAPLGLLGGTDNPAHLSAVFYGRFAKTPPAGCNDLCGLANVGAHEIGHAAGFQVIPAFDPLENLRIFRGGAPDLMRDGQPQPDRPLFFNMTRDRNIRAVEQLNRIGDNTPK